MGGCYRGFIECRVFCNLENKIVKFKSLNSLKKENRRNIQLKREIAEITKLLDGRGLGVF